MHLNLILNLCFTRENELQIHAVKAINPIDSGVLFCILIVLKLTLCENLWKKSVAFIYLSLSLETEKQADDSKVTSLIDCSLSVETRFVGQNIFINFHRNYKTSAGTERKTPQPE